MVPGSRFQEEGMGIHYKLRIAAAGTGEDRNNVYTLDRSAAAAAAERQQIGGQRKKTETQKTKKNSIRFIRRDRYETFYVCINSRRK